MYSETYLDRNINPASYHSLLNTRRRMRNKTPRERYCTSNSSFLSQVFQFAGLTRTLRRVFPILDDDFHPMKISKARPER